MGRPRFTQIHGLTNITRPVIYGKIRLGVVKVHAKTGKSGPDETPYFVVPPEVAAKYGERPTELDVMFGSEEQGEVFPQAMEWYGSTRGLKCQGDLKQAARRNEATGQWELRSCPCELRDAGECKRRGHLIVLLHTINFCYYQIDVGSFYSIININSALEEIRLKARRLAFVPLKLRRVPQQTLHDGALRWHYPLKLFFEADAAGVNAVRQQTEQVFASARLGELPPPPEPEIENPAFDDGATIVETSEDPPEDAPVVTLGRSAHGAATGTGAGPHPATPAPPVLQPSPGSRTAPGPAAGTTTPPPPGPSPQARPSSSMSPDGTLVGVVVGAEAPKVGRSGKWGPAALTIQGPDGPLACRIWESTLPVQYQGAQMAGLSGQTIRATTVVRLDHHHRPETWITQLVIEEARARPASPAPANGATQPAGHSRTLPANDHQVAYIRRLAADAGVPAELVTSRLVGLTRGAAMALIDGLKAGQGATLFGTSLPEEEFEITEADVANRYSVL